MPQMGVSVAEGTIADWKKRVGDWVERDETILEISTDKIETEIPSPTSGRITEILVEVGVTVPVGEVLARIDSGDKPGRSHADEHPDEYHPPISPVVRRIAADHKVDLDQIEGTGMRGRITKKDVLAFIERAEPKREQRAAEPSREQRAEPVLHMESPYVEDSPTPPAAPTP